MASLREDTEAYEVMRPKLEAEHLGQWVVVHDRQLALMDSKFETIAAEAMKRFGRGPFLLTQVGEGPLMMPSSVFFRPAA